jgi:hypothetical protein
MVDTLAAGDLSNLYYRYLSLVALKYSIRFADGV